MPRGLHIWKIEVCHVKQDNWIYVGVIANDAPHRKSFEDKTSFGWAGCRTVWIGGANSTGFEGWDHWQTGNVATLCLNLRSNVRSIKRSIEHSIEPSIERSIKPVIDCWIEHSIARSIEPSIKFARTFHHMFDRTNLIERSIETFIVRSIERSPLYGCSPDTSFR